MIQLQAFIGFLTALVLATGAAARAEDAPTLKDAYKDHFRVGVAINRTIALGEAVQANNVNRTLEQVKADIALTKQHFDHIAPENDLKWALIHPREGANGYNFGPADAFVEFGRKNNLYLIGHTLVWHAQTPDWVFAGKIPPPQEANTPPGAGRRFGYQGPRASREELLQRMREHIHTVVGRYKGKIKVWDVVNEALSDGGPNVLRNSLWLQIIGPDFIAKAFEYAHEADPDAILRYNDYSLENPAKRQKLITLIKELQAKKVPVHAIGTQTHVSASSPSYEEMERTITELETLGLPIHVTELDVNSAVRGQGNTGADIANNAGTTQGGLVSEADKRLAEQYANLFQVFLKHKSSVKLVTFWGVNDAVSWRANGRPLLFDGNNRPKPAFDAVIRAARTNGNANGTNAAPNSGPGLPNGGAAPRSAAPRLSVSKFPLPILPALPDARDTSFYANNDVPHGRVEQRTYKTSAGAEKRMHVYLPPDYRTNTERRYPVLYLNHGGGENDSHWTAANPRAGGFANLILDNLLAAGRAKPMIIVMPNSRDLASGDFPRPGVLDACSNEYLKDILPFVDAHYRTKPTRECRALAGLSMGGFVVLNTGLNHLDTFGELYVFSSGYWPDRLAAFQENARAILSDPAINEKFRMPIYFAAGETDIAFTNSQKTMAVFNSYGIRTFSTLSSGGHEWMNWRRYLYQTAQIMFPEE